MSLKLFLKKNRQNVMRYPLLVLPIAWITFSILIILVNCIPDRLVKQSIQAGIDALSAEGDHPWIFFTPQSQLDNFTDRIMLQMSQRTSSWNTVTQYFSDVSEWPWLEANSLHNPLFAAFSNQGYPRYWHGYTVFLKPLLVFFSFDAIRVISFVVLLILLGYAFYILKTEYNLLVACVFSISMTMINVFVVPLSLVFAPVVYLTVLCVIGIRSFYGRSRVVLFLLVGSVINFLDFLTFPLLTLCFPLGLLIYYDVRQSEKVSRIVVNFISSGFAWLLGYAATWFVKWIFSSVITGKNIIKDAIENILIRTDTGDSTAHFDKMDTIVSNYDCLFDNYPIRFIVLVLLIVIVAQYASVKRDGISCINIRKNLFKGIPLLVLAIAPVIWYFLLVNHSNIHMEFFAYRNAVVTVFSILMYLSCISIKAQIADEHVLIN